MNKKTEIKKIALSVATSIVISMICASGCANQDAKVLNGLLDGLCSFDGAGKDDKAIAGDDYSLSPIVYVSDGKYEKKLDDSSLIVKKPNTNGVIINNTNCEINKLNIDVNLKEADGKDTCDFTGKGSAFAVYGNSDVIVKNSNFSAKGVACLSAFVDNGASLLMDNVRLSSTGGTIYKDYVNSPAQDTMVAPPWVLGIAGTSRCTNLLGDKSTMTIKNSKVSASNWAILSLDMGHNMNLNVLNTSMKLTGSNVPMQEGDKYEIENPYTTRSGYGTYVIGESTENLFGVKMDVGTYASIFTGGKAYYGNLERGKEYKIYKADGSVHDTYISDSDIKTVVYSDTFGFMSHQGENECMIDGAMINSKYTNFLVKSGNNTNITIENDAKINAENGILLQLMDNDDSTTEFDAEKFAFGECHKEYSGFPTVAIENENTKNNTNYTVKNTKLTGDIYNGIGWIVNDLSNEKVNPMSLNIELAGDSELDGAIASTACIHASYDGQKFLKNNSITAFDDLNEANEFANKYQKTMFTQSEYFNIGQVANFVSYNGKNNINVVLKDSAIWRVSKSSLINSLEINDNAKVIVDKNIILKINDKEYGEGIYYSSNHIVDKT